GGPAGLVPRLRGGAHVHRAPRPRDPHARRSRRRGGGRRHRARGERTSLSARARHRLHRGHRRGTRHRSVEAPVSTWIAIAGVSLSTFLLRASFLVFIDPHRFPGWFRQALKFVPPSVLAAIVAPGLVMAGGTLDLSPLNPRLLAGLVAIGVTLR